MCSETKTTRFGVGNKKHTRVPGNEWRVTWRKCTPCTSATWDANTATTATAVTVNVVQYLEVVVVLSWVVYEVSIFVAVVVLSKFNSRGRRSGGSEYVVVSTSIRRRVVVVVGSGSDAVPAPMTRDLSPWRRRGRLIKPETNGRGNNNAISPNELIKAVPRLRAQNNGPIKTRCAAIRCLYFSLFIRVFFLIRSFIFLSISKRD